MKRSIYTGLHYLMMPVVVGRLKWLARKNPGYGQNLGERFGYADQSDDSPIWIHAVSVGETIASEPLVRRIQQKHPEWPILITSTTPTGADQVARLFGNSVIHQYAPYDLPGVIERFLERTKPRALVVMETELWPNWIEILSKRNIPVLVANARLSEKSAAGYARLGAMAENMMSALTTVAAQYSADAQRFVELGVPQKSVKVLGNIKADIEVREEDRDLANEALRRHRSTRSPVIVAASTHPGEEEIILDALVEIRKSLPEALLYLVPRHSVRAAEVIELVEARELKFVQRSSEDYVVEDANSVVLCDKMGELRGLFGVADIVLMGGTLVEHGGHNPLEPAAWRLPVVAGPSQRNFDSLFREMEAAGALIRVNENAPDLAENLCTLWTDQTARENAGQAALDYLVAQQGAADRLLGVLEDLVLD